MGLLKFVFKSNLFITFYILHYFRFFNLRPYVQLGSLLAVIDTIFCLYFFHCFVQTWKHNQQKIVSPSFKWLYLFAIISIFIANIQSGQSLYYGLRGFVHSYLNLGFLYYLIYKRYKPEDLIKICLIFAFAHSVALLLANVSYPNSLFGYQSSIDDGYQERSLETRGVYRFSIPGEDLLVFALLYLAGTSRKFKGKPFLLMALFFLIFVSGIRSYIIFSALVGLLAYLFGKKVNFKRVCLIVVFPIAIYTILTSIPFTKKIADSYMSLSEQQYKANQTEDDIRLQNIYYFSLAFNEGNSILPNVVGNGPIVDGPVAKKLDMASQVGLWLGDVEYMCWFVYFGVFGLVLVLWWGISCMSVKIPRDYYCFKMMILFWFIVMACGTSVLSEMPIVCIMTYGIYAKSKRLDTCLSK